jgi:hypothetical protein
MILAKRSLRKDILQEYAVMWRKRIDGEGR